MDARVRYLGVLAHAISDSTSTMMLESFFDVEMFPKTKLHGFSRSNWTTIPDCTRSAHADRIVVTRSIGSRAERSVTQTFGSYR